VTRRRMDERKRRLRLTGVCFSRASLSFLTHRRTVALPITASSFLTPHGGAAWDVACARMLPLLTRSLAIVFFVGGRSRHLSVLSRVNKHAACFLPRRQYQHRPIRGALHAARRELSRALHAALAWM